jgi:hypothetical protein
MRRCGKRRTQPKPVEVLSRRLAVCFDPPPRQMQPRKGNWPGFRGRRATTPLPDDRTSNTALAAKL